MGLIWRIFVGNAAVLAVATTALVLTPVTVSFPAAERELLVLAAGLTVMLGVNLFLLRRTVADQERREWAGRALAAQEAERVRIARELHDEVGQGLTSVLLQLDRAAAGADGESAARIREARESARTTLEEVRVLAANLRPEVLDHLGLPAAIRQLCVEAERTGMVVDRAIDEGMALDPVAEVAVYRIAQEACTNALRHSRGERLSVTLEPADRGVLLRVEDDGGGLPTEGAHGAGVSGMRERAMFAGARLSIGTGRLGGTAVELRLP